ncbi:hypothetical protein LWI28_004092 [Acer negundo]|uniref:IPT/TIG domain-containing protein n=1 Tax=Acer negundo TaxID=4023 RepID=A0AAD5J3N5_ACENE|nr:hypothetical protein LWI28_004092 [Acer negundo]
MQIFEFRCLGEPGTLPAINDMILEVFFKKLDCVGGTSKAIWVLRFFRKDGHNWLKKKDGRAFGEAHERLEGKPTSSSVAVSPEAGASSTVSLSPNFYTTQNPGSTSVHSDFYEPCQSSSSPGSVEVSSEIAIKDNGVDIIGEFIGCDDVKTSQALRRLEEHLSLNDDIYQEIDSLLNQYFEYKGGISKQEQYDALLQSPEYTVQEQYNGGHPGFQDHSSNFVLHDDAGIDGQHLHQSYGHGYADGSKGPLSWQEVLETCTPSVVESQVEYLFIETCRTPRTLRSNYLLPGGKWLKSRNILLAKFQWSHVEHSTRLLPQEVNSFKSPAYSSVIGAHEINSDYNTMFFNQDQIGVPLEGDLSLTVAQKQKFTIREISLEWGYTTEATKVIIVGSFLYDSSESSWLCIFGDIEVPIQIIQDGVIRCEAPPRPPGKVTLYIISGNRESCSEVKEFDYQIPTSSCIHNNSSQKETTKSRDELLLLVRFVQMPSDSPVQKGDEHLKDELQRWLSSKSMGESDQPGCSLSKKERGIIHMIAGLGFEWALNSILSHGVNVNFRDINGWTALHWASRFGREKMVAALLASGAFAGAETDPISQD